MAGMLPGVESARRRRTCRRSASGSSVMSCGLGYARIRIFHLNHTSFLLRSMGHVGENLGAAVREAKERLDGRLRGHFKSEIARQQNSEERATSVGGVENLQMEVLGSKESGSRITSLS